MELYKKHRPKRLKQIVGNKTTVDSLQNKIDQNKIPHAILLTGPPGTGKTTIGRIIKNELNCHDFSYTELDSVIFRGIDTIRDIRKEINFMPLKGSCKVYLIDECHMLGTGGASSKNPAQNALLKMLEDTPKYVYFILCTTDPQMLMKTIKSRCVTYEMQLLNYKEMETLIKRVLRKEGKEIPDDVLNQIISDAKGSSRNALQILDKIIDLNKDEMLDAAKQKSIEAGAIIDLSRALMQKQSWKSIATILKNIKNENPESIRRGVLAYAQAVLLNKGDSHTYNIMNWFEDPTYDIEFPGIVLNCYRITHGVE